MYIFFLLNTIFFTYFIFFGSVELPELKLVQHPMAPLHPWPLLANPEEVDRLRRGAVTMGQAGLIGREM